MITGDNLLTAVNIGKKLKMGPNQFLYAQFCNETKKVTWIDEHKQHILFDLHDSQQSEKICKEYMLCLSGEDLPLLQKHMQQNQLALLFSKIIIFARTSPSQKEFIITSLKNINISILMCGDGTNDVGGLKKADVGIAIVAMKEETNQKIKDEKKKQKQEFQEMQQKLKTAKGFQQKVEQMKQYQQFIKNKQMHDPYKELFESSDYKIGDACIAAPFTSRYSSSIKCVIIIMKQGLCTLATTIQTYKAYSLTVLHQNALKFSEIQATISGICAAANYYYFSNAKPLKQISPVKPQKTIFEFYSLTSIISQSFLHLYGLHYVMNNIGLKYSSKDDLEINNDEKFIPTFINTAVFLYSFVSQTCIFLFNHSGKPHMEGLLANKGYLRWLIFPLIFCFIAAFNYYPLLNYYLELKFENIEQKANKELIILFALTIIINYAIETILKYMKFKKLYEYL